MKLTVISPETADPRELAVLPAIFAAGLETYHLRKPGWSRAELVQWLTALPAEWRACIVLHAPRGAKPVGRVPSPGAGSESSSRPACPDLSGVGHRAHMGELSADAGNANDAFLELADEFGLAGVHLRDDGEVAFAAWRGGPWSVPPRCEGGEGRREHRPYGRRTLLFSRACHDLATLHASLGHFDRVLLSPIFPSISKPGHAPDARLPHDGVAALLAARTATERRTQVFALGGVDASHLAACRALGFDGVAVLGAIWRASDPLRAFREFLSALTCHAAV